jgi:hypothetical protein
MRLLERTPDRLVLEIRPVALLIVCVGLFLLFFVLGFGLELVLPFLARLAGFPDAPGLASVDLPGMNLLGYASVIPLLIAAFVFKVRRLTLDRGTGRITLAARGLFGRSETSHALAGFRGASVRRNRRGGNNSVTYTAILHFDGQDVPVTPYGTGGSEPLRIAETVNAWLGPAGGGQSITLTGEQAAEALAALQRLGIVPPR